MMDTLVSLAPSAGLTAGACAALNLSRAGLYRQRADLARPATVRRPRPSPRRSLGVLERQAVLDLLRAPRFADQALWICGRRKGRCPHTRRRSKRQSAPI